MLINMEIAVVPCMHNKETKGLGKFSYCVCIVEFLGSCVCCLFFFLYLKEVLCQVDF